MKICYVDEAGDVGLLPSATSPVQPVLVIAGIMFDHRDVPAITEDFIDLKRRMFPAAKRLRYLESILWEIKGADVRRDAACGSRNKRRHALHLMDGALKILENYEAKIVGRVWVKSIGQPFNGHAVYTYSVQSMFAAFQNYLQNADGIGIFTADSRSHTQNRGVSHSIFTQKFKRTGDDFDRIADLPTFADSQNHAGIQLCDLLCSAFLFPMSVHAYCTGQVHNLHIRPRYRAIRERYAERLRAMQHRYQDDDGKWRGGITVSDGIGQNPGSRLFRLP